MKTISLLCIFLLLTPWLLAATYTSSGSGDFNSDATWGGGGHPVNGDVVNVANGHTVTCSDGCTAGDGSTANVIKGTLVINPGITFTNNAPLTLSNSSGSGALTQGAGSTLDMSGGAYDFNFCVNAGGSCTWTINGTSASRALLKGGTGKVTFGNGTAGTTTNWNYATITGFTSASANQLVGYTSLFVDHCFFNGNAAWIIGHLSSTKESNYTFTNNDFRSITPVSNSLVYFQKGNATPWVSTGLRTITGNTFVGDGTNWTSQAISFRGVQGFTLSGVLYDVRILPVADVSSNTWDGTVVWAGSTNANWKDKYSGVIGKGGTTFQNGVLGSTVNNWHGIDVANAAPDVATMNYIQDSVLEAWWELGESTPNVVMGDSYADSTIQRNISLGAHSGILPNNDVAGTANNINIYHNTFANFNPGGGATAIKFDAVESEFVAYRTGGTINYKSNIVYNNGANTDNISFQGTNASYDSLTDGDYNSYYAIGAAYQYVNTKGGPFGAHDLSGSVDPRFKNASCTIGTYAVSLGGTTLADYFAGAVKRNGYDASGNAVTYNSAYSPTSLLTYLRDCYTPRNSALKTTGHDGTDIGATNVRAGVSLMLLMGTD